MSKKNSSILILSLLFILILAIYSTYAFFVMGNFNINNAANVNLLTDENNMVFDVLGGQINLSFNASALKPNDIGNIVAQNTTTLTVNFQPNTTGNMVCSYDIVYEWNSSDKYQSHSPGATGNEFTIQGTLTHNSNVSEGANHIQGENDLANLDWDASSAVVVSNAQIDGIGSTTSTAVWTITAKFYNANADQGALAGKTLSGKFKVSNVKCKSGTKSSTLAEYITYDAPRSGTSAVGGSAWILTSDRTEEWRYAGKNPDNYIQFNGELWRIIGLMPNTEYCTGVYGSAAECDATTTGSLIKIIKNNSLGYFYWDYKQTGVGSSTSASGSNDWSDSQLMLTLNGPDYLYTAYDINGNNLHDNYGVFNGQITGNDYYFYNSSNVYLYGSGTTLNIPSSATTSSYTVSTATLSKKIESGALSQIATVKWDLYGTSSYSTAATGSPEAFYNKERNINDTGTLYTGTTPENRPVYWYGKIGLMYPSDYGYATNGGTTYNRNTCLGYQLSSWSSGSYKTDCAGGSFLWYNNITSSAPGTSGTTQWTMSPYSGSATYVFYVNGNGSVALNGAGNAYAVSPVLYLKAELGFGGGNGTYNSPYLLS